jgi:undecaprenyl-diphosphatase
VPASARPDRAEALWLTLAPVIGQLTLAVLAAVGAMYLFILLAHEMAEGETRQFDVAVLQFLHAHRSPWLFAAMYWVSWMGGPHAQPYVFGLCILGFALARRFWPDGLTVLLAGVGGTALIYVLKRLFHRPRPEVIFDSLGYSFPSGHSFFALVLYCTLAYWLAREAPPARRRWIWGAAIAATLLMGFSRMYLGEHYPSDVAAGFAVAVPWVWGCLALPGVLHRSGRDLTPDEKRARYLAGAARLRKAEAYLPELTRLARGLAHDPELPALHRLTLWFLWGYLASPVDLIPDFIPLFGAADDLFFAGVVLDRTAKAVSAAIIQRHWSGDADLFPLLAGARSTITELWRRE